MKGDAISALPEKLPPPRVPTVEAFAAIFFYWSILTNITYKNAIR